MDALKNLIANLQERFKTALAEGQESPSIVALRERFEELPPNQQKGIMAAAILFALIGIFFLPISNMMDSSDLTEQFNERRSELKELLKIQSESAAAPSVPAAREAAGLKALIDLSLGGQGIKPEQIRVSKDAGSSGQSNLESHGMEYSIEKVTIRQAFQLIHDIESKASESKVTDLQLTALQPDPHFYTLHFKAYSFGPKLAAAMPVEEKKKPAKAPAKDTSAKDLKDEAL
jgi:hypothetical protein